MKFKLTLDQYNAPFMIEVWTKMQHVESGEMIVNYGVR